MVKLVVVFFVHETAADVPDADSIMDAQPRTGCCHQDVFAVGTPFVYRGIGGREGADFLVIFVKIIDVDLAVKHSPASNDQEATIRRIADSVPRRKNEAMDCFGFECEYCSLHWHVAVYNAEVQRIGRPSDI
jgi:hypothetical protein